MISQASLSSLLRKIGTILCWQFTSFVYYTGFFLFFSVFNSGASGAPFLSKLGNLSIPEILVVTSAYARLYRLWGRGRGVPRQPEGGGWLLPSFLGGKSRGAFGQPAFFLAGNRMTIVAFEKEVFLKSLIFI